MSKVDDENLTYENESTLSQCTQCNRFAEENSNLEKLIWHLKSEVRKLKKDAKEMMKHP